MEDNVIMEGILKEFEGLAKHPRPSRHEEEVSNYIMERLAELGIQGRQDEVFNIIADVPATKGKEAVPLTILQGHMDMVCVAKPGVAYDPLKDPIRLKLDGTVLSADGTSLGADDGMAIAIALFLIQQDIEHGPLRLIFTVDEETGMTGAIHLDPRYVADATYVINCDSESLDVIAVGSAGSVHTHFCRSLTREAVAGNAALTVKAADFLGGHSGETINRGKSNAVKAVAAVLQRLAAAGIDYRLAEITGGVAANAIPEEAAAVIVLDQSDVAAAMRAAVEEEKEIATVYGAVEKKATVHAAPCALPADTFSAADTKAVVDLITLLHCGVFAMNQQLPTLPDLSASLGTIRTEKDTVKIQYFPRSSADARLLEFARTLPVLARLTGFSVDMEQPEPAWTANPQSTLTPLMAASFRSVTGREARIEAMHGGLETGYLFAMNPKLDIVSVGPTTHAIHSADESVELDTAATLVRIIIDILGKLK